MYENMFSHIRDPSEMLLRQILKKIINKRNTPESNTTTLLKQKGDISSATSKELILKVVNIYFDACKLFQKTVRCFCTFFEISFMFHHSSSLNIHVKSVVCIQPYISKFENSKNRTSKGLQFLSSLLINLLVQAKSGKKKFSL